MNDAPHPLVHCHQLLRQLGGIQLEVTSMGEQQSDLHTELGRLLSEAWKERQTLTESYFSLLRSLAGLCEDFTQPPNSSAQLDIEEHLHKLLTEHGLEFVHCPDGCSFDPVHHLCVTTISDESMSDGKVVSVVARELVLHNATSPGMILRPASVVVNRLGDTQDVQEHTA